jgi:hypothetical protein
MKTKIITIILSFSAVLNISAQTTEDTTKVSVYAEEDLYQDDPYYWSYTKEIGVNFTPLISKLVPFNLGEKSSGNVGLLWKKYYSKRAFRIRFGANIDESSNSFGSNFLFFSIGLEKRYPITTDKKFTYTSGWDLFFNASEENFDDNGAIGIAKTYGFEYHFTKRLFISTEAQLSLGIGGFEGPRLKFQIPQAIFVNVRLY